MPRSAWAHRKKRMGMGSETPESQAVDAVGTPTTHVLESVCVGYTCRIHPAGPWSVGRSTDAGLVRMASFSAVSCLLLTPQLPL